MLTDLIVIIMIISLFIVNIKSSIRNNDIYIKKLSNYQKYDNIVINEEINKQILQLKDFLLSKSNIMCITGAGVSTSSGIPDYRGPNGSYKKGHKPIVHNDFISNLLSRQRYWSRSIYGWNKFNIAYPNHCHNSLTLLQKHGYINTIITQNVDRLHQKSGSNKVIDLHGRNDQVICLSCNNILPREIVQNSIESLNDDFIKEIESLNRVKDMRADGDADIGDIDFSKLRIPECPNCTHGILKPNVIFFGDHVPKPIVDSIYDEIDTIDGMIVIGTSLEVFSSYRFVERANALNIPIVIVNAYTETRAERKGLNNILMRIDYDCTVVMRELVRHIQLNFQ